MKPALILFATTVAAAALLLTRKASAATGGRLALPFVFSEATGQGAAAGDWPSEGLPTGSNEQRERANVAAFLAMIRAAEGTAPPEAYGALFGWPAAGRNFDPYSATGHPRVFFNYTDKSGKTVRTSAAGAYQIIWTTWSAYYVPFMAWCGLNGRECTGFTPGTQDSFAEFLLSLDGALDDVKAGRLPEALAIARKRWASLPGAGYNQPERSQQFVINAYTNAGGRIA